MTKGELITLLKEHKENQAKLNLRKKEKRMYEKVLKQKMPEIEITMSASTEINADIRSKYNISDKVGNTVVNSIVRNESKIEEARQKIAELESIIENLENKVEEAEIRLGSLYYKERMILTAYYVDNRTAEDISQKLYFELFNRTCSPRYVRDIIKTNTEKILKL